MKPDDARLVRHLAIAVALKLLVLGVLWWAFVRDDRVGIDADGAATHMSAPINANAQSASPTGAPL